MAKNIPQAVPDPFASVSPEVMLLLGAGVLILLGLVFVAIAMTRRRAEEKNRLGKGEDAPVTLQITLPKFQSDEEGKQREAQQTTKEKVAVAETLFAALGGLPHDKSLKAWLTGHYDVVALEIVAL
ncbi:MAG: hypothetical protein AAB448_01490, partial [Patescibacteria group bacterium]